MSDLSLSLTLSLTLSLPLSLPHRMTVTIFSTCESNKIAKNVTMGKINRLDESGEILFSAHFNYKRESYLLDAVICISVCTQYETNEFEKRKQMLFRI